MKMPMTAVVVDEKMSAIDQIKEKLKKYSELNYQLEGNTLSITPLDTNGFRVWLAEDDACYTVGFDGWHEEFECESDALDCFAFGLSDQCRLKIVRRGDMACSWTVESKENNEWKMDSRTGLIFVPFWRKKSIEYRYNSVIRTECQGNLS